MDKRKFSISRVTNLIFRQPAFKDTVYLCSTYNYLTMYLYYMDTYKQQHYKNVDDLQSSV